MSRSVTVRSLTRAGRLIKKLMNFHPEGWESPESFGRAGIRQALEAQMQERVCDRLAESVREGVSDRRNGAYRRHLLTGLGDIELSVPRTRRYNPVEVLRAYARRTESVDRAILACFVLGLSTRKVAEGLLPFLGERVSPSTVSRVAQCLDAVVAAFHRRPLTGHYTALLFDGVVLRRRTGAGAQSRPVLVAMGIRPDGKKEILDFRLARAESEDAWLAFLTDLWERGLRAEGIRIVSVDGGVGLLAALPMVYPHLPVQRCWAHKVRNILDKVRRVDREKVRRSLATIYEASGLREARSAARRFVQRWQSAYPRAVACLRKDLEELLTFFRFEDPDWRRATRTTNAIERRFREVRRRTRPMGVMADQTSIERILYAVFSHENQNQRTGSPFLVLTQNT